MKKKLIFIVLLFLLSGCDFVGINSGASGSLTPYHTVTVEIDEAQIVNETPEPAAVTPQPTATPRIHTVTLNDTISLIALQYGVTIEAILLANPDIEPNAMIVGDEVIIPGGENIGHSEPDPLLASNLDIGEVNCIPTGDGLWCGLRIKNNSDVDLEFPVVAFTFIDNNGGVHETRNVPAVLRRLPSGGNVPVVTFFEVFPQDYEMVQATLFSVENVSSDAVEKEVIVESSTITLDGASGTISGVMRVESNDDSQKSDLTIAAAAIDADGKLVGIRRIDSNAAVETSIDFAITMYAAGEQVTDLVLYAEAY